jgi:hypothetical protein
MDRMLKIISMRDRMAEELHKIWGNWYTHQLNNSTKANIKRWNKQAHTKFKDLSREDRDKDKELANRLLEIMHRDLAEWEGASIKMSGDD